MSQVLVVVAACIAEKAAAAGGDGGGACQSCTLIVGAREGGRAANSALILRVVLTCACIRTEGVTDLSLRGPMLQLHTNRVIAGSSSFWQFWQHAT